MSGKPYDTRPPGVRDFSTADSSARATLKLPPVRGSVQQPQQTRPARRRRAHLHLSFRCNWTDQTLISAKAQQAEDGADAGPGLCLTANTVSVPSAHTSPSALSPSQKGEIRGQTESSRA
ncbi:hypothetical protein SRHO_G00299240 [Serrasalmus rhombeus]